MQVMRKGEVERLCLLLNQLQQQQHPHHLLHPQRHLQVPLLHTQKWTKMDPPLRHGEEKHKAHAERNELGSGAHNQQHFQLRQQHLQQQQQQQQQQFQSTTTVLE